MSGRTSSAHRRWPPSQCPDPWPLPYARTADPGQRRGERRADEPPHPSGIGGGENQQPIDAWLAPRYILHGRAKVEANSWRRKSLIRRIKTFFCHRGHSGRPATAPDFIRGYAKLRVERGCGRGRSGAERGAPPGGVGDEKGDVSRVLFFEPEDRTAGQR